MTVLVKRKQNDDKEQGSVNTLYHTITIHVPEKTPLADSFNSIAWASNSLYNTALFYLRCSYTGNTKPESERKPLEQQAINDIESILPEYKRVHTKQIQRSINKLEDNKTNDKDNEKEIQALKEQIKSINEQTTMFPGKKKTPTYNDLDLLFKTTDNENYRLLPAHAAQHVIQEATRNFDNFWDAINDYNNGNSRGYTGRPSMPNYLEKGAKHTVELPAVHVKILTEGGDTQLLKLPKIKETLRIGKNMPKDEKLVTVRIVPVMLGYDVQLTYETVIPEFRDDGYKAGGDLGLNNLATIVVNDGHTQPLVYNGRGVKSINQYFNKQIAKAKSKLPSNVYTSKEIHQLCTKRINQLHDIMNYLANDIALKLLAAGVSVFVLGLGKDFKDAGKKMRSNTKQSFYYMPFRYLADAIVVSCALLGIKVIIREESYTSKASLIDGDPIPTLVKKQKPKAKEDGKSASELKNDDDKKNKVTKKKHKKKRRKKKKKRHEFSGSRVHRGLYKSGDGFLLNADVNGAGNILRKEFPDAFDGVTDFRYLMNPVKIQLPVKYSSASWSHEV